MAPKGEAHHHRSTLSQSNKAFKARHATKGSLKQLAKGRVEKNSKQGPKCQNQSTAGQKAVRKNLAKQLQAEKRRILANSLKVFSGPQPAPRIVIVLALSADIDTYRDVLVPFMTAAGLPVEPTQSASSYVFAWPTSSATYKPTANGTLLQFILIPHESPLGNVISLVAAADFLLPVLSAHEECTSWGERCLRSIQALGGPSLGTLGVVFGLGSLNGPDKTVKHQESARTKASLLSFLAYFFPDTLLLSRISSLDSLDELSGIARRILEKKPAAVAPGWRDGRARLVGEKIKWVDGALKITGHVRGGRFSSNRLIHIPLCGDFKLSKITIARGGEDGADEEEVVVSAPDPELADDLVSENSPSTADEMMAEQTWPTQDEIASAPANQAPKPKRKRRVPIGTSDYQAAWIPEGQEAEYDNAEEDGFEDPLGDEDTKGEYAIGADDEKEETQDLEEESDHGHLSRGVRFVDLADDMEKLQLAEYRASREQQRASARQDEEFPDEIDTPLHIPARERFARYRGMKSLRTSPWDPYENLPAEYGKVFAFQDWKVMGRKLNKKANEVQLGVGSGMRVTLHVADFPREAFESNPQTLPLVAFSLLQHEHKYSVMHFTTQRNTEYGVEIKSKDSLVVCVGFRFFVVNPIWSQPSVRASNNVHKFERYLRHGRMNVGTAYMPVTFGSTTPVVVLQEPGNADGQLELVGSGTLVGSEPRRIIAKRIVITGHPYKVHKKTATIRYMFFNREDIEYFKPVELRTKKGRSGHIKEPLGTHGYFKARFDGPIDQMDTVCMSLYKRCFPKWAVKWTGGLGSIDNAKIAHDDKEEEGKMMEVDS